MDIRQDTPLDQEVMPSTHRSPPNITPSLTRAVLWNLLDTHKWTLSAVALATLGITAIVLLTRTGKTTDEPVVPEDDPTQPTVPTTPSTPTSTVPYTPVFGLFATQWNVKPINLVGITEPSVFIEIPSPQYWTRIGTSIAIIALFIAYTAFLLIYNVKKGTIDIGATYNKDNERSNLYTGLASYDEQRSKKTASKSPPSVRHRLSK